MMLPNDRPVAELRDLSAKRGAQRQYAKAERFHRGAASELMVGGWYGLAGAEFNTSDMIHSHALEELTAQPLHPGAW